MNKSTDILIEKSPLYSLLFEDPDAIRRIQIEKAHKEVSETHTKDSAGLKGMRGGKKSKSKSKGKSNE